MNVNESMKNSLEERSLQFCSLFQEKSCATNIIDSKSSGFPYVKWGVDNKLPYDIWNNYLNCSELQSLINTTVDYIIGDGITSSNYAHLSDDGDNIDEVVRKCVFDFVLFGGYAVECIRNQRGEIVRVNYQNVMNVRIDEDLTTAYLSPKWNNYSTKNVVTLPLYDTTQQQPHFIYFYRGAITRGIYPVPMWFSGMKSVHTLNETRTYNLRNIQNNFAANVMIALNGTSIKSKELQEIKDKLELGYSGADNAGKTLIINNANADGKVEITRLESDKAADLYKNVQDSATNDLYTAFRINKMLVGQNVQTGFAAQEFENAYALYDATTIRPIRNNIQKQFSKLNISIMFNSLIINWKKD